MTTTLEAISSPAAYVAHQRLRSAQAVAEGGRPLVRLNAGALRRSSNFDDGRDVVPLWVGERGLMLFDQERNCVEPATAEALARYLGEDATKFRILAPADRRALAAAMGLLNKSGAKGYANELQLLASLPTSTKLVVLTEALERRFWTPQGVTGIEGWMKAFNAPGPLGMQKLAALTWGVARNGFQGSLVTSIIKSESSMLDASRVRHSRGGWAYENYACAKAIGAAWSAFEAVDENLLGLNTLTGTTVAVTGAQWGELTPSGVISDPCRVKPGSVVLMLGIGSDTYGQPETAVTDLRSLQYSNGALVGTFGKVKVQQDFGGTAYFAQSPFLASYTSKASRWQVGNDKVQPTDRWSMTLDVAVAGGPTE